MRGIENQRWAYLQYVRLRAACAYENTPFSQRIDCIEAQLRCRQFGLAVDHQFHPGEEARASDITNHLVLFGQAPKFPSEIIADTFRPFLEALTLNDLKYR